MERWRFFKESQLRKRTGVAALVLAVGYAVLQSNDFGVAQFAEEPNKWLRARDILGFLPLYGWVIAGLLVAVVVFFEGGFRASRRRDRRILKLESDALERLEADTYEYRDYRGDTATMSLATILQHMRENLAAGMSRMEFQTALSMLWDGTDVGPRWRGVLAQLRGLNLVQIEHRPGARPDNYGMYKSIHAMPMDVYYLTDQGANVLRRASYSDTKV